MNIEQFFAESSYAATTTTNYRWFLKQLQDYLHESGQGIEELTAIELKQWLYSQNWNHNSRYSIWCAIRAFLHWFDPQHPALKMRIKRGKTKPQRTLDAKNSKLLLDHFGNSPKDVRDRAIIALMLDTGLRIHEVAALQQKHLCLEKRHIIVHTKGDKWEKAVYSATTVQHLQNWLVIRKQKSLPETTSLFVSVGGTTSGNALTAQGLRSVCYKISKKAGIKFSPHDLRRTFVVLSLQNGAPTRIVQKAGRWANIKMVERYSPTIRPEDMEPYFPVDSLSN